MKPTWDELVDKWQPKNRALMRARAGQRNDDEEYAPCIVSPNARYRRPENQLYRVEIHGDDDPGGRPTFKFSRENGTVVFPIEKATETTITLGHLGRDARSGLVNGDWVEIVDDSAPPDAPRTLLKVTDVDLAGRIITVEKSDAAAAADPGQGSSKPRYLRRWDQRRRERGRNGLELHQGAAVIPNEKDWIALEDGIEIQFQAAGTGTPQYRFGRLLADSRACRRRATWNGRRTATTSRGPSRRTASRTTTRRWRRSRPTSSKSFAACGRCSIGCRPHSDARAAAESARGGATACGRDPNAGGGICVPSELQVALEGRNKGRVQPKLRVGAPNDPHEDEADRVADEVMRIPTTSVSAAGAPIANSSIVRRQPVAPEPGEKHAHHEDEEVVRRRTASAAAQGQQPAEQSAHDTAVSSSVERQLSSAHEGSPLPQDTRGFFESRFGHDFSRVHVAHRPTRRGVRRVNRRARLHGRRPNRLQRRTVPAGYDRGAPPARARADPRRAAVGVERDLGATR